MEETLVYHQPGHLSSLENMRSQGELCDVTIQVENGKIKAHKCVLAAASKYFKNMFVNNFKEKNKETINIKDVSATNMDKLVRFAYTGQITLTKKNAISLIKDADYFALVDLKEAGLTFLKSCLNVQNVYEVHCFAESLCCTFLSEDCKQFMLNHFGAVSLTDYYVDYNIEFLSDLLLSGNNKISENIMFEAVMKWIMTNVDQRKAYLPKLLGLIRLSHLSLTYLTDYLFKDESTAIHYGVLAAEVMCFYKNRKRDESKDEKSIIAIRTTAGCNIVEIYNPASDKWQLIEAKRANNQPIRSATVLNGKLYAIGDTEVQVYDHQKRTWEKRSSMNIKRQYSRAATLNGFVYVCGGFSNKSGYSNIVERYCPESDEWHTMSPMNCSRGYFAVTAFRGLLYAMGGRSTSQSFDTVERYDPHNNQWTMLDSKMNEPRYSFGAAVLNEKLYVCGGLNGRKGLSSVEVYDPEINRWKYVTHLNTGRVVCLVVANIGKLWAVGGEDKNGSELSIVEMYDPEKDSWTFVQPMSKLKGAVVGGLIPNC